MAKEKKVVNIDDDIIEVENFELKKTGSLGEDLINFENVKDVKIKTEDVPEIEVQEIYIRETGNFLNLQENFINIPIEMIYFPFFTPQKQNKRVNFKYTFEDLGVTMYSTLVPKDKKDKVFQPSIFEEKIYTFLISMYQDEKNKKMEDGEVAIEFEITDFIVNFLGNKMNRTYYTKVEQALKNLKNTLYQFEVSNHTKFGKNKFEDSSFQLLNYQKLKVGKKSYYRVILNKNIVNKIKSKRYIKYNTKNLLEIMIKDPIASRIYRYISKIRYKESKGEINIRTLAAIIPLKMEQRVEKKVKNGIKEYFLSRTKPVLERILKAFESLMELGYLTEYEEEYRKEEETYYIHYLFNKDRDGDCHVSEFVKKSDKKNVIKEDIGGVEEEIDLEAEFEYEDNIEYLINKAKKNPKISIKWNAWVDKKLKKITAEEGEEYTKRILNILSNTKINIEKGLPFYIDGILKNLRGKKKAPNTNMSIFGNVGKEKGAKSKNQIKQARKKGMEKISNLKQIMNENELYGVIDSREEIDDMYILENKKTEDENLVELKENNEAHKEDIKEVEVKSFCEEIFEKVDDLTKLEIEDKALELFRKSTNVQNNDFILSIKNNNIKIYYNMISIFVREVINRDYKELMEK